MMILLEDWKKKNKVWRYSRAHKHHFSFERVLQHSWALRQRGPSLKQTLPLLERPSQSSPAQFGNFLLFSLHFLSVFYSNWETLARPNILYVQTLATLDLTFSHPNNWEFLWEIFVSWCARSSFALKKYMSLFIEAPWRGIRDGDLKHDEGEWQVISKSIAVLSLSCNWKKFYESLKYLLFIVLSCM